METSTTCDATIEITAQAAAAPLVVVEPRIDFIAGPFEKTPVIVAPFPVAVALSAGSSVSRFIPSLRESRTAFAGGIIAMAVAVAIAAVIPGIVPALVLMARMTAIAEFHSKSPFRSRIEISFVATAPAAIALSLVTPASPFLAPLMFTSTTALLAIIGSTLPAAVPAPFIRSAISITRITLGVPALTIGMRVFQMMLVFAARVPVSPVVRTAQLFIPFVAHVSSRYEFVDKCIANTGISNSMPLPWRAIQCKNCAAEYRVK